jgi:RHS repeat-associated protein
MRTFLSVARRLLKTRVRRTRNQQVWWFGRRPIFELLESRHLLSAVIWDAGGDGASWNDRFNWSGDTLPSANDDVMINVAGNPTITYSAASGASTIHSLSVSNGLVITGGSLSVTTDVNSTNNLTLSSGTLNVLGQMTITTFFVGTGGNGDVVNNATIVQGNSGQGVVANPFSATFNNVTFDANVVAGNVSVSNVTVNGTFTSNGDLNFNNGDQTLAGTGNVLLNNSNLGFNGTGTLTVAPTLKIHGYGNVGTPLVNQGTIEADSAGHVLNLGSLTNNGTLRATNGGSLSILSLQGSLGSLSLSGSGSSASLGGSYTIDQGLTVPASDTVSLGGTWSSAAPMNISGTLNLGGSFSTAGLDLPQFSNSGGQVNLTGILDNSGTTLPLTSATGSWYLKGGTIDGGSITGAVGASLQIANGAQGTLNGVTLNSDLTVDSQANGNNGRRLLVTNGLTLNSTLTLLVSSSLDGNLLFTGNNTLSGVGQVVMGGSTQGSSTIKASNSSAALTIAPGMLVHGEGTISGGTFVNQGTIQSEVTGAFVSIGDGTFRNQGALSATNGGSFTISGVQGNLGTVSLSGAGADLNITSGSYTINQPVVVNSGEYVAFSGNWFNAGGIDLEGGSLYLGGFFTTAAINLSRFTSNGGSVFISGFLNNTGTTLALSAATGTWYLNGGTIIGGTVSSADGAVLAFPTYVTSGTLDGVTLNTDLTVSVPGDVLNVKDGLAVNDTLTVVADNHSAPVMQLPSGDQTFAGTGQIVMQGQPRATGTISMAVNGGTTNLTIAPGLSITGNGTVGGPGTIINQGTLQGVITVGSDTFINQGRFLATGTGSSGVIGPLTVNSPGLISVDNSATLNISSDLTGNTRSASLFNPAGTVQFNSGRGTSKPPQLIEVMSNDLGATQAGFHDNFAFGNLALTSNSYARLVDQSDNSAGTGAETLYADELIVPAGATLDLNGLHVYVRGSQISGQILNGSVTQIPGGGPLEFATPTPSSIGVVGAVDRWTFFGRAGHLETVVLNPGASGSDPALAPQLGWGSVMLLNSLGAVLASGSSSASGSIVLLSNVSVPSDGTYTIQIEASAGHSDSIGNYVVSAYDVTPSVNSLAVNQQYTSTINNQFAADQWTFSATGGQQVRLNVVNDPDEAVAFDLTGQGGYTAFTNLTATSGLITLPSTGNYVLTTHSAGTSGGGYVFDLAQTSVLNLGLGVTYNGTLAGSGTAQLFQVVVPSTQSLFINLNDGSSSDVTELYAKLGAPPTRGTYDFSSANTSSSSQQILVPSAAPGTWYILIYGDFVPFSDSYTLSAIGTPLQLTHSTPDRSATGTTVTLTLTGSGFDNSDSVELVGADNVTTFTAVNVVLDTPTQLSGTFDLASVSEGSYSVRVTRPDSVSAELPAVFSVIPTGDANLETHLVLPSVLGFHDARATIYVEYSNTGNTAMRAPLLLLYSFQMENKPIWTADKNEWLPDGWNSGLFAAEGATTTATLAAAAGAEELTDTNGVQILATGSEVPGMLEPGESMSVPVYYAGMQKPWSGDSTFQFGLQVFSSTNPTPVDWTSLKTNLKPPDVSTEAWNAIYSALTSQLGSTWGQYVSALGREATYLGAMGHAVTDIQSLWQFAIMLANGLSPITQLDGVTDLSVQSPRANLDFSRQYLETIISRNTLGRLGYGWTDNWQYSLNDASDGTVTVTMPSRSIRVFVPDSRGSDYFDEPGDFGKLSKNADNTFALQETNGQVEHFNIDGTLDFIQDTNGNRASAGYSNGNLSSLTSSSGASLSISYDAAGLIGSVTGSDGRVVIYNYDANKQLTSVQSYDDTLTKYAYDTRGNLASAHSLTAIQFPDQTHQFYAYDTGGRLATMSRDGGAYAITFGYSNGEVTATDASSATSEFWFDERGMLTKFVDPLRNPTFASYDDNFNLIAWTGPSGLISKYTYDSNGNVTSETNPLGQTTDFAYTSSFNQLASTVDARGNTTAYTYDAKGDLVAIQSPDQSIQTATFDGHGDPLSIVNPNGQATSVTYNTAGQITSATVAGGTQFTFTYDLRGNLKTAAGAAGTTSLSYDSGDRLTNISYPTGRYLQYAYDSAGRRIRMTDQSGFIVNYAYDSVGRLRQLTDGSGANIVTYSYNNVGLLSREDKGNNTYTTYQYDANGNVLHLVNFATGGSVNSRFDYSYDALGHVSTMSTRDGAWTYSYDNTGQLTHALFTSQNPAVPDQDLTYVYDSVGNRMQTVVNAVTITYTTNSVNEYTNTSDGATYKYDSAGNLISKTDPTGTTTYVYDSLNRLVSAISPTDSLIYEYDALGNRSATIHNDERTEYLIDPTGLVNIVGEYDGTGNPIARFTYGFGLTSQVNINAAADYFDFDTLGSTAGITGTDGIYANSYTYTPFGETLTSSENMTNSFEFVGEWGVMHDGNTIEFMRQRFYGGSFGRFLSPDPLFVPAKLSSQYDYANNEPTRLSDPLGLWFVDIGVSGGIGGVGGTFGIQFGNTSAGIYVGGGFATPGLSVGITGNTGQVSPGWGHQTQIGVGAGVGVTQTVGITNGGGTLGGGIAFGIGGSKTTGAGSYTTYTWGENGNEGAGGGPGDPNGSATSPGPSGGSGGVGGQAGSASSIDPNALLGPNGYGAQHFIDAHSNVPYEIDFENASTATAPAQRVTISNQLDPNLDLSTFQLTQLAFGDTLLLIPNSRHFQTTVSATDNGETFDVHIEVGLNTATRTLYATFQSEDSTTGLPPDVLAGFLPPEDDTGRGMGHISYTIQAKPGTLSGTQIRNVALVTFDRSNSIATDQVSETDPSQGVDPSKQALVTIDSGAPNSLVSPLPATESSPSFTVSWSGQDDPGGSGIASYNIYVSDDGGSLATFVSGATSTSAVFHGVPGHTYSFYSAATDHVGNTESTAAVADAATTVPGPLGDYNRNSTVDAADYVLWRKTLNNNVSLYNEADGSGNGTIDSADYNVWRVNFSDTAVGSGSDSAERSSTQLKGAFIESTAPQTAAAEDISVIPTQTIVYEALESATASYSLRDRVSASAIASERIVGVPPHNQGVDIYDKALIALTKPRSSGLRLSARSIESQTSSDGYDNHLQSLLLTSTVSSPDRAYAFAATPDASMSDSDDLSDTLDDYFGSMAEAGPFDWTTSSVD